MGKNFKTGLTMGLITFFLAIIVVSFSRAAIAAIHTIPAFIVLSIIIFVGIIFDTIGVAAAAADEPPFNARAARKDFGAKEGFYLVRNADKVATFCSDIVGDICGTVSGALGALLVIRIVSVHNSLSETLLNLLMVAFIASLTVGGKGFAKGIGIRNANIIIGLVGNLIARFKTIIPLRARRRVP